MLDRREGKRERDIGIFLLHEKCLWRECFRRETFRRRDARWMAVDMQHDEEMMTIIIIIMHCSA